MAGIKISELPAVGSPTLTDVLAEVQSGVTYQVTLQQISDLFGMDGGILDLAHGGTGADLTASNGGIFYSTATAGAILAGTPTAGLILTSGASSAPTWSTSTFPIAAGSAGQIIISNGTNWVGSTPTYPNASVTGGKFIISDGTNYIASTSIMPNTVGAAGVIIRSNGTSNAYSTSTFADTYAINSIVYASSANALSGLAPSDSCVLSSGSTGIPTWVGPLTNGQVIIGSTSATPVAGTLTAGPGISISNGAGSITISGTGSGIGWTEVTGTSQAMSADNGYVANNAGLVTLTLPATAAFGTAISVIGKGAGGWKIAQNSGQNIQLGSSTTTVGVGGSITSTNQFDSIDLICTVANTTWTTLGGPQGVLTVV